MGSARELREDLQAHLARAHRRLRDKHLLGAATDAVSVLVPGAGRMLYQAQADATPRELPLDHAEAHVALHGQVYLLRPDAGALASLTSAASQALVEKDERVPIVFDEQARHIGKAWQNVAPAELAGALIGGANAGLVEGRLLIIGVTPNRMIFNAELFEKCASAYLLARGGEPHRRTHWVPWWVRLIAGRRLRRDQATAARHHAEGRPAPELTAY